MRRRRPATRPSASAARTPNPTRYARETGQRLPRWRERLTAHEQSAGDDLFVHFSDVPRMVVYPDNSYHTPTGFYAYELNRKKMSDFATERRYLIVFRPRPNARLLRLKQYAVNEFYNDRNIILSKMPASSFYKMGDWDIQARGMSRGSRMWNITRNFANERVGLWASTLYGLLGYDGVIDDCMSIIHGDEPCQAVFFNTGALELVDIIDKGDTRVRLSNLFTPIDRERAAIVREETFDRVRWHRNVSDVTFRECSFLNMAAYNSLFVRTKFDTCVFNTCSFSECRFAASSFVGSKVYNVNFYGCQADAARMSHITLEDGSFQRCQMKRASFEGASLLSMAFWGGSLERANFKHANLRGCVFGSSTNLDGASFDGATIRECSFDPSASSRVFSDVSFVGATYDPKTEWPNWFVPEEHGMIRGPGVWDGESP